MDTVDLVYGSLWFAAAYALKGGWLSKIPFIERVEKSGWVQGRLLDGLNLSVMLLSAYCVSLGMSVFETLALTITWMATVTMSIGEEVGSVGRFGKWWGEYRDYGFGRSYGMKKALQRGCWNGALFALLTGNLMCIPFMTIGFVVAYFVGQEIYWRIYKKDSWAFAEPVYGFIIGLTVHGQQLGGFWIESYRLILDSTV